MDKSNNPIDKQFREYFQDRSLTPSEESWTRLDILLDAEEKPKVKRKSFYLYKIAAAIVVITAAIAVWYNISSYTIKHDTIIAHLPITKMPIARENAKPEKPESEPAFKSAPLTISANKSVESTVKGQVRSSAKINRQRSETTITAIVNTLDMYHTNTEKVSNSIVENPTNDNITDKPKSTKHYEAYINPDKLLADVEIIKRHDSKVLGATSAAKSYKPDPAALLQEAETNASRSFLQKMYKGLQDNSSSIYAIIINRNYEDK
jgi:hypothetical protein